MITTTLARIRKHRPCEPGWKKLLAGLGKTEADDEPLPFTQIVEINGLDDALWCCRVEPQYDREWRLFAVWCARQVQHLMKDPRSIAALDVAERYAHGQATEEELDAARTDGKTVFADAEGYARGAPAFVEAVTTPLAATAAWYTSRLYGQVPGGDAAQTEEFLKVVNETEGRE